MTRTYSVRGLAMTTLCSALVYGQAADALPQTKRHTSAVVPAQSAPKLNSAAVEEARAVLDDKLLDYPAARFRTVRLVKTDVGFNAFCGDLNVTNRMGGYMGWRAFVLPLGDLTGAAALYDKPTIEGQPTAIATFMNKYGDKKIEEDSAARLINGACGDKATQIDQQDYATALVYKSATR